MRGGTAQITGDVNEKGPENFESVFMHIDSDGDFDMDSPAHSDSNKNDEDIIVASPSAVMQRNLVEASSGGTTCPMPYRLVLPWRPICELSPTPSSTLDTMDSIANSLKGSGSIGNLDYDANIIRSYIKVTTDHIKNLEIDQSIELVSCIERVFGLTNICSYFVRFHMLYRTGDFGAFERSKNGYSDSGCVL